MLKNAFKLIMLLVPFAFFVASCSSSRSTTSSTTNRNIDRNSQKELRKDVAQFAKEFRGIPYKYAGKTPKLGFDCSGFTSYVFREFNIEISPGSLQQSRTGRRVAPKFSKPGDLIFFGKHGKVNHVALVTKNNRDGIEVVHSTSSQGIMVQNISKSNYWKPKILFARDVISR